MKWFTRTPKVKFCFQCGVAFQPRGDTRDDLCLPHAMPLLVIDNKRKRVQEWASSNYERLYEQMHAEEQEARNKTADEIYARQQQASTKYFQLRNGVLDALGQVQQNSGQDFFRRER